MYMTIKEFELLSPEQQTELFTSGLLPENVLDYLYSFNNHEFDPDFYDEEFGWETMRDTDFSHSDLDDLDDSVNLKYEYV